MPVVWIHGDVDAFERYALAVAIHRDASLREQVAQAQPGTPVQIDVTFNHADFVGFGIRALFSVTLADARAALERYRWP